MSILTAGPARTWDDDALVQACLAGDERAWTALVAKYERLVFSVPRKYRLSDQDAADVFQTVWIELYNELPKLRNTGSLRAWLLTVASHQAFHWKRRSGTRFDREGGVLDEGQAPAVVPDQGEVIEQAQQEQSLRDTLAQLSPRCRELIRLLFYEDPPVPYARVATQLGIAVGSIGFIRGRCLKKMHALLRDVGF